MESEPLRTEPGTARDPDGGVTVATPRRRWPGLAVGVGQNLMTVRDRVQWGPIFAGAVIGFVLLLVLTLLGLGIGASAFEPDTDVSDWDTWAGVWGGLSVVVAFFGGGWIAARSAAVGGSFAALLNGLLAGAALLVALLLLTTVGLTNVVGFLGGNLANIADYVNDVADGTATPAERQEAFDAIRDGAWGTLVTVIAALVAAALGGVVGRYERHELVEGTG